MTRRRLKTKPPKAARQAKLIGVPEVQIVNDNFELCDAPNLATDFHRGEAVAPKVKVLTVRRKCRFHGLALHPYQIAVCQWYADAHALRYDTQGVTARYGEGVKSGKCNFDHMPTTPEQEDALANFSFARAGISPSVLGLFESVVLYGGEIGSRRFAFAIAIEQLTERIEGRVQL